MKKHTKVYLEFFYPHHAPGEFTPCEVCRGRGTDVHHILNRKTGSRGDLDEPYNLMLLCRTCHEEYGDLTYTRTHLQKIHGIFANSLEHLKETDLSLFADKTKEYEETEGYGYRK